MEQHNTALGVMNRRMNSIKVILNYWKKGDFNSVINSLGMIKDNSVVMDVLNHTIASDSRVDMLNYENVGNLLQHCTMLVNNKYETYILTGLRTTKNLLAHFGPQITQLKTIPVSGGVDLAREDRMRKADACSS